MPIGWVAKKQTAVALSTAEAEYRAITELIQRSIYAQTLATTFVKERPGITLQNDNMPAIAMLGALGATKRSKFIDLRHNYIKQVTKTNNITIVHVPSKTCPADIFTKALERQRYEELRNLIDVDEIENVEKQIMG